MATDPVRDAARAADAIGNLLATWIPDVDERRRAAHAVAQRIHNDDALRAALERPAAPASDAGAMREACAAIPAGYAKNAERLAETQPEDGFEDHREEFRAMASMLRAIATQIRRLLLPPAPVDAVEQARRTFYEAARASMDANCNGGAFGGGPNEAAGLAAAAKCMDAYTALLAAEASAGRDGMGG